MIDSSRDRRDSRRDRHNSFVNAAILTTLAIILLNPTGLIGSWLVTRYDAWKSRQAVTRLWPTLESVESRLFGPDQHMTPTVIEFIDYECIACREVAEAVSRAVLAGRVEVVVRHFPLVRIHPNARSAALAAICSEHYGRFEEAHYSLLTNDDWTRESDWTAWAESIGIDDSPGFQDCLEDGATAARLAEDIRLAEQIGVSGTPSCVTRKGVLGGVGGLTTALAEQPGAGRSRPDWVVNSDPVFDSRGHPDPAVSVIGNLGRGSFLAGGRIALLDEKTLLFIDLATGDLLGKAGGGGDGPGEFRAGGPALAWFHRDGDLAIWDALSMRLTVYSPTGELVSTRTLPSAPPGNESVRGPGPYFSPVGVFSDGAMVFSEFPQSGSEARPLIGILEADWEGRLTTIVKVPAHQSLSVLFGYRTYTVIADDKVVADNETDSINVHDRSGVRLFSVEMPGRRSRVTDARAERALAARRRRDEQSTFGRAGFKRQYVPNEVVPPIDRILVDSDGRLWVRVYRLAEHEAQSWYVGRGTDQLFLVEMPRDWALLDASGELILVRETDQLDVHSAVVRRMERRRVSQE